MCVACMYTGVCSAICTMTRIWRSLQFHLVLEKQSRFFTVYARLVERWDYVDFPISTCHLMVLALLKFHAYDLSPVFCCVSGDPNLCLQASEKNTLLPELATCLWRYLLKPTSQNFNLKTVSVRVLTYRHDSFLYVKSGWKYFHCHEYLLQIVAIVYSLRCSTALFQKKNASLQFNCWQGKMSPENWMDFCYCIWLSLRTWKYDVAAEDATLFKLRVGGIEFQLYRKLSPWVTPFVYLKTYVCKLSG